MSLSVRNPVLGTGLADSTKIDENFADVTAKFGSIDNSDIKAGAGIDITKLAAYHFEIIIPCSYYKATAPTFSSTVPVKLFGVPQDDTTTSYLTTSYSFVAATPPSGGTAQFKVEYGHYNAGAWVNDQTVLATTTITNTTVTPVSNTVAVTLANSGVIATPRFLGLFFIDGGAAAYASGVDFTFTLKCKRTNGLRT